MGLGCDGGVWDMGGDGVGSSNRSFIETDCGGLDRGIVGVGVDGLENRLE